MHSCSGWDRAPRTHLLCRDKRPLVLLPGHEGVADEQLVVIGAVAGAQRCRADRADHASEGAALRIEADKSQWKGAPTAAAGSSCGVQSLCHGGITQYDPQHPVRRRPIAIGVAEEALCLLGRGLRQWLAVIAIAPASRRGQGERAKQAALRHRAECSAAQGLLRGGRQCPVIAKRRALSRRGRSVWWARLPAAERHFRGEGHIEPLAGGAGH